MPKKYISHEVVDARRHESYDLEDDDVEASHMTGKQVDVEAYAKGIELLPCVPTFVPPHGAFGQCPSYSTLSTMLAP